MIKLTSRQEKFCQCMASGLSQFEAYKQAGYTYKTLKDDTIRNNAYKLMKSNDILTRINEIQKPIEEKLQKKIEYTVEDSLRKIIEIQNLALTPSDNGRIDLTNALKAEELKAKLLGLNAPDKQDVDLKINKAPKIIDDLK